MKATKINEQKKTDTAKSRINEMIITKKKSEFNALKTKRITIIMIITTAATTTIQ